MDKGNPKYRPTSQSAVSSNPGRGDPGHGRGTGARRAARTQAPTVAPQHAGSTLLTTPGRRGRNNSPLGPLLRQIDAPRHGSGIPSLNH